MTISRFSESYFSLRVNFESRFIASRITANKGAWLKVESRKELERQMQMRALKWPDSEKKVKNNSCPAMVQTSTEAIPKVTEYFKITNYKLLCVLSSTKRVQPPKIHLSTFVSEFSNSEIVVRDIRSILFFLSLASPPTSTLRATLPRSSNYHSSFQLLTFARENLITRIIIIIHSVCTHSKNKKKNSPCLQIFRKTSCAHTSHSDRRYSNFTEIQAYI